MDLPTVIITGATGLLGRAVVREFRDCGRFCVVGTGFSRGGEGIVKVDLTSAGAVDELVGIHKPALIIHCAAERRPDVCENDSSAAEAINVATVWHIARCAAQAGSAFVHISTDYIFDGKAAPYGEEAFPHPLNAYGRLKLRAEYAALAAHPNAIVLRVPVLYGPTEKLSESAATCFVDMVLKTDEPKTIDDWQIRVPTYTVDIARTLLNVANAVLLDRKHVAGIFHYSGQEQFTRYSMCRFFADLLGVPMDHIKSDPNPPTGAPRPFDCQLDCSRLESIHGGLAAPRTPFSVAIPPLLRAVGLEPK